MLDKWTEGPGRTCELVKTIQKGSSRKMVVIEVKNEYKETVCFQADFVHVCHRERGLSDVEMLGPYLARKTFTCKDDAVKHCKVVTKKEDDQIKEAERKD